MDISPPRRRARPVRARDVGRKRAGKAQKKRLAILKDPNILAFKGWEDEEEPWTLDTCERFIEWCHIDKLFPWHRHSHNRKASTANITYCLEPVFKRRCIDVHCLIYAENRVKNNRVSLQTARMVYAEKILDKRVDWSTITAGKWKPEGWNIPESGLPFHSNEGLGKSIRSAFPEPVNDEVEWSEDSSSDEYTHEYEGPVEVDFAMQDPEEEVNVNNLDFHLYQMCEFDENNREVPQVPLPLTFSTTNQYGEGNYYGDCDYYAQSNNCSNRNDYGECNQYGQRNDYGEGSSTPYYWNSTVESRNDSQEHGPASQGDVPNPNVVFGLGNDEVRNLGGEHYPTFHQAPPDVYDELSRYAQLSKQNAERIEDLRRAKQQLESGEGDMLAWEEKYKIFQRRRREASNSSNS